jgi:alpha-L-arabinofuranosidase
MSMNRAFAKNLVTTSAFSVLVLAVMVAVNGAHGQELVVQIQADRVVHSIPRYFAGACIEDVNHEIYGGIYSQMIFGESFQEPAASASIPGFTKDDLQISGLWRAVRRGSAAGRFRIVSERPFAGGQSQQLSFDSGDGDWGIENQGLNHWGMSFFAGKSYEGYLWARAEKKTELTAALESRDGSQVYAQTRLIVASNDWQRLDFTLTPDATDPAGRFTLTLKQPGSVTIGHAFLQPGEWGRFKGLPVRRDVAEGLIAQGINVLRYGGSMVNAGGYRWKNMIGPRDRRPPYPGTWYRYSSDGWGILDFMDFCEAVGFEYIPDFNMGETPHDMADFIEYAKGADDTPWGRRRVADGHPQPYRLHYIELGNEERVDAQYADKFEKLAKAVWDKDKDIIPVVGDFAYNKQIQDPLHFSGADSGITNLEGQRRILQLAKEYGREVWFDVHVWTDHSVPANTSLMGMFSFADALDKLSDGARHKVVVFELNANNHSQKRAVANAQAILAIERDGRIPIVASANGLQPDGQNDNGWNQGLLFLDPSHVWLQPPGYLTQMLSQDYLPQIIKCDVVGTKGELEAVATRSNEGKTLVLQAVNPGDVDVRAQIHIAGFMPVLPAAQVTELSGAPEAVNTASQMEAIVPKKSEWPREVNGAFNRHTFPAHSVTVMQFQ